MNEQIVSLKAKFEDELAKTTNMQELDAIRVAYLGKKGSITDLLKGMKDLPNKKKKTFGQDVNTFKAEANEKGIKRGCVSNVTHPLSLRIVHNFHQYHPPKEKILATVSCR